MYFIWLHYNELKKFPMKAVEYPISKFSFHNFQFALFITSIYHFHLILFFLCAYFVNNKLYGYLNGMRTGAHYMGHCYLNMFVLDRKIYLKRPHTHILLSIPHKHTLRFCLCLRWIQLRELPTHYTVLYRYIHYTYALCYIQSYILLPII